MNTETTGRGRFTKLTEGLVKDGRAWPDTGEVGEETVSEIHPGQKQQRAEFRKGLKMKMTEERKKGWNPHLKWLLGSCQQFLHPLRVFSSCICK